ncbi:hypothetical protein BX600DRAFT_458459 [Xylariales sp. PMI_506]|nr:hypothetical protein BX600DRAFT_458459 [Xylariales sp. PMI_506]
MYFSTYLPVLTAAAAGLSAALPHIPAPIAAPRAVCQELAPQAIGLPINYNVTNTVHPAVQFVFPGTTAGPGPCTLVAKFPAGTPIRSSGNDLVNVVSVGGGAIVGTLRFTSAPNVDTLTTINSFACEDVMAYQLEISGDQEGWVYFQETTDAGLFMEVGDSC